MDVVGALRTKMATKSNAGLLAITVTAILMCSTDRASACSRGFLTYKVASDFEVAVTYHGKPIEGIKVEVDRITVDSKPGYKIVATELTGKDGKASFHGLVPGNYFVASEHSGVGGGAGELLVVAGESGKETIDLTWPSPPIMRVQHIAGTLAVGEEFEALAGASLSLTDALSSALVGETSTDGHGRFAFETAKPGLYVLHIEEKRDCDKDLCKIKGNILVQVDASAEDFELPRFGLVMSSCGLSGYKDANSMVLFEV